MYAADLKHPDRTLQQKLHKLYRLNRGGRIELSFRKPYLDLLSAFNNPHLSLPPFIHVAGTNGKGSILATLRSILEESGYSIHVYTSPHLLCFNERIVLAGEQIHDAALEALIDETLALNEGRDCTFFEITTAMAFAAFSRIPADILLLETGLGGRLDCTNIVEKPLVSVISRISYDHMEYLGESLPKIAAEKAGIIKGDAPCILGVQSRNAAKHGVIEVFEEKAHNTGAALYRAGKEWVVEQVNEGMRFVFEGREFLLPLPNLCGAHQIDNAGAALAALKVIENTHPVRTSSLSFGLRKIKWRGRLELLPPKSLKSFNVPEDWEIWFDGGHNDSAGEALGKQAAYWREKDNRPLHLVVGMKADKDPKAFLSPLLPYTESLSLVEIEGVNEYIKAPAIIELFDKMTDIRFFECANVHEAASNITRNNISSTPARILVCGSLYLAEQVY